MRSQEVKGSFFFFLSLSLSLIEGTSSLWFRGHFTNCHLFWGESNNAQSYCIFEGFPLINREVRVGVIHIMTPCLIGVFAPKLYDQKTLKPLKVEVSAFLQFFDWNGVFLGLFGILFEGCHVLTEFCFKSLRIFGQLWDARGMWSLFSIRPKRIPLLRFSWLHHWCSAWTFKRKCICFISVNPGTWWPSIYNMVASIGWWTKSLHTKIPGKRTWWPSIHLIFFSKTACQLSHEKNPPTNGDPYNGLL